MFGPKIPPPARNTSSANVRGHGWGIRILGDFINYFEHKLCREYHLHNRRCCMHRRKESDAAETHRAFQL